MDNYQAGVQAAVKLADTIGGSGKIAVMTHVESAQNCQEREQGFTETIAEKYPDIEIVNISHQNEETSVSEMAESVLKLFSDVKGYFCTMKMCQGMCWMQSLHPEKKWQLSESMRERNKKMPLSLEKKSECWYKMLMEWLCNCCSSSKSSAWTGKMMKVLILEWNGLNSENISDERYANYLYD